MHRHAHRHDDIPRLVAAAAAAAAATSSPATPPVSPTRTHLNALEHKRHTWLPWIRRRANLIRQPRRRRRRRRRRCRRRHRRGLVLPCHLPCHPHAHTYTHSHTSDTPGCLGSAAARIGSFVVVVVLFVFVVASIFPVPPESIARLITNTFDTNTLAREHTHTHTHKQTNKPGCLGSAAARIGSPVVTGVVTAAAPVHGRARRRKQIQQIHTVTSVPLHTHTLTHSLTHRQTQTHTHLRFRFAPTPLSLSASSPSFSSLSETSAPVSSPSRSSMSSFSVDCLP